MPAVPLSTDEPMDRTHHCPAAMTIVIVVMTLLVIATGLNPGFLNRLIDLSVGALLQQMAGGYADVTL